MSKRRAMVVAGGTAVEPFRHRHDGWTPERQGRFLERLAETGCVREACAAVGLSSTSGYRAYARMPDFAAAWERALAARRPMLEDAAFERATRGVAVPITRNGKVVGKRQRFSDGLLRFLIDRNDRRDAAATAAKAARRVVEAAAAPAATQAEVDAALLARLEQHAMRMKAFKERKAAEVVSDAAAPEDEEEVSDGGETS